MDDKKSSRSELESKRVIFFEIGLITALVAVIAIFKFSSDQSATIFRQLEIEESQMAEITISIPKKEESPPKELPRASSASGGGSVKIVKVENDFGDLESMAGGVGYGDIGAGSGEGAPGVGSGEGAGFETVVGRVRNGKDKVIAIIYFRVSKDKIKEFERKRKQILKNMERKRYPGATPDNPVVIIMDIDRFEL